MRTARRRLRSSSGGESGSGEAAGYGLPPSFCVARPKRAFRQCVPAPTCEYRGSWRDVGATLAERDARFSGLFSVRVAALGVLAARPEETPEQPARALGYGVGAGDLLGEVGKPLAHAVELRAHGGVLIYEGRDLGVLRLYLSL